MAQLTPEERQKIYLEEKARLEFRRELEPQKIGFGKIIGYVVLGGIGLLVVLWMIGSAMQQSETASNTPTQTDAVQTGNPAHDRLAALGASAQASALGQIAGEGCSGNPHSTWAWTKRRGPTGACDARTAGVIRSRFNRMRPVAPASWIAVFLRPSPACRVLRS